MALLTLQRVSKSFDGVTAVFDVTCTIDRGQVVGFLGPNGAGKTTTMRMITRYYEPDAGDILFDGQPLASVAREAKRRIGYLPENNPLYTEMLVAEYLDYVARLRDLRGSSRRAAVDDAVARTGVAEVFYRPIGELSKGYRQRVGLAQAILHEPDLLVLDEPTEGLDPNQRIEIRRLIGDLGRERTVILSTHVLPEVQHTCSRLLVIHRGRLAADGSVDDLVQQAKGALEVTVEVRGEGVADAVAALPGVGDVREGSRRDDGRVTLVVTAESSRDVRPAVFELAKERGWTLYELHQATRSLEDLFRQLTAEEPASGPGGEA